MPINTESAATIAALELMAARSSYVIPEALEEFADNIFEVSQDLVPVDTGELKSTGKREKAETNGIEVSVEIAYTAEHALHVHEDLEVQHPRGQAKYLEEPMNENASSMAEFVAGRVAMKVGL